MAKRPKLCSFEKKLTIPTRLLAFVRGFRLHNKSIPELR